MAKIIGKWTIWRSTGTRAQPRRKHGVKGAENSSSSSGSLQTLPPNSFDGRHAAGIGRSDFEKTETAQENRFSLTSG